MFICIYIFYHENIAYLNSAIGKNYVNHTEVYMSCDIIHDMLSEIRVTITFGILVITHA